MSSRFVLSRRRRAAVVGAATASVVVFAALAAGPAMGAAETSAGSAASATRTVAPAKKTTKKTTKKKTTRSNGTGKSTATKPSRRVPVQLLSFNDFHGQVEIPTGGRAALTGAPGGADVGGVAYLAAHLQRLRAGHANSLTVAAGDLIGSSPYLSGLFRDEPSVEALGLLGLDVSSVGNHEFDRGVGELLRLQYGGCSPTEGCAGPTYTGARYQWLAGNVTYRDGVTPVAPAGAGDYGAWFGARTGRTVLPPTTVRTVGGVRIGFIGLTLEGTSALVAPEGVADVSFTDEVASANLAAQDLRDAGVRTIVVLLHEGGLAPENAPYDFTCTGDARITGPVVEIAQQISSDVDLILSGHTHEAYSCRIPDPSGKARWVTSAASYGRMLTEVNLAVDSSTGEAVRSSIEVVQHPVTRDVEPDAAEQELIATWQGRAEDPVMGGGRTVGSLASVARRSSGATESSLADLVADAQLSATAPEIAGSSVAALVNPGSVRSDLGVTPTTTAAPAGGGVAVTYANAWAAQPQGLTVYSVSVYGADLLAALEQQWRPTSSGGVSTTMLGISGLTYSWSRSAPVGAKVDKASVRIGGKPLVATSRYRITMNSQLATGVDGFTELAGTRDRVAGGIDLHLLRRYLAAHPQLVPPTPNRATPVQ
ncbi:MAG: bifunctional metallophosphatase/5'-nucleotidase [Kineosporiaceae bacterium]